MSLSDYRHVLSEAVAGRTDLSEFREKFMAMFLAEAVHFPEPIYQILNDLFLDSDEFEPDSALYESCKLVFPDFIIDSSEYANRIAVALNKLSAHATQ